MKKQTKGSKTKEHLYKCAIELFKTKGYNNVSVDEIVNKAGTAKGTFYIYYESKASIINTMLQQYDSYYDEIYHSFAPDTSVDEQLDYIIRKSCEFTTNVIGLDLIRVLYQNQLLIKADEQDAIDVNRTLYKIISSLILQGQQDGEYLADQDFQKLTAMLIRCLRGTFYEWCMQDGTFDLVQESLHFTRMFRRAFKTT